MGAGIGPRVIGGVLLVSTSACSILFGLDGYAGPAKGGVDGGDGGVDAADGGDAGVESDCAAPLPVAYWKLDEGEGGVTADSTGNGNVGTLVGNPIWVTDVNDGTPALAFDGMTTQYVDFGTPADLSLHGSMTVSAWFNVVTFPAVDGGGPDMPIVSKRGVGEHGWQLYISDDETVFDVATDRNSYAPDYAGPALAVARWYHVVGVYDPGGPRIDLYLDGALQGSIFSDAGVPPVQYNAPVPVHLGNSGGCSVGDAGGCFENQRFSGIIDEVRVYAQALNACQVKMIP